MMHFEYDPERLIEEVKKRPPLWDFDSEQYRCKDLKHRMWGEIVKSMLQDDVKITKTQKRELELQLQKKWKSMRDCYRKYTQNPNRTKRPYIYHKQLRFLQKGEEETATSNMQIDIEFQGSNDGGNETDEERQLWKSKKAYKIMKSEETSDDDQEDTGFDYADTNYVNCSDTDVSVSTKKVQKAPSPEIMFVNTDPISRVDSEDTDKMFLLSLLPHLKAIPEERRLEAKMSLMKVLKNA